MTRTIHVTVAMPATDATKRRVEDYLAAKYGEHTTEWHLDDSLLGGIVIFDGENVYDGSLKGRLKGLKV